MNQINPFSVGSIMLPDLSTLRLLASNPPLVAVEPAEGLERYDTLPYDLWLYTTDTARILAVAGTPDFRIMSSTDHGGIEVAAGNAARHDSRLKTGEETWSFSTSRVLSHMVEPQKSTTELETFEIEQGMTPGSIRTRYAWVRRFSVDIGLASDPFLDAVTSGDLERIEAFLRRIPIEVRESLGITLPLTEALSLDRAEELLFDTQTQGKLFTLPEPCRAELSVSSEGGYTLSWTGPFSLDDAPEAANYIKSTFDQPIDDKLAALGKGGRIDGNTSELAGWLGKTDQAHHRISRYISELERVWAPVSLFVLQQDDGQWNLR